MKKISILMIGDHRWHEFRDLRQWCQENASVILATDIAQASQVISATDDSPDLMVLLTIRPDQFSMDDISHLQRRAPFSAVISLLGSWCEGGQRTSRPMDGVIRMYWHRFEAYLSYELQRIDEGSPPSWTAPKTTSEDDWLSIGLKPLAENSNQELPEKRLLVFSKDYETGSALVDAFQFDCCVAVCNTDLHSNLIFKPTAIIWDNWALGEESYTQLTELHTCYHNTPIVALVNFPRYTEYQRLRAAGATAILTKPYQQQHLRCLLDHTIAAQHQVNRDQQQRPAAA